MNIIIKTPNFIGDTIMMMSALELVKMEYPNAKITIVCKEYSKDLFRSKNINKIIIYDEFSTVVCVYILIKCLDIASFLSIFFSILFFSILL